MEVVDRLVKWFTGPNQKHHHHRRRDSVLALLQLYYIFHLVVFQIALLGEEHCEPGFHIWTDGFRHGGCVGKGFEGFQKWLKPPPLSLHIDVSIIGFPY